MINNKAWIRILEAFLAIMMIGSVLLTIYSKQPVVSSTDDIYRMIDASLDAAVNNNIIRQDILNGDEYNVTLFIGGRIPPIFNFTVKICGVYDLCPIGAYHVVYARERIVSSTLQDYGPKKLRLFVWEK
jgi:hypothetical protein